MPAATLAVILAAGAGTRLRPLTDNRPKCLLEVGGRPLLDYQLEALASQGVREVLVVTGRDVLCLHADVLFHPAILRPCLHSRDDVTVVVDKALVEETMKTRVEENSVVEIGKTIPPEKMFGTFLGIARFAANTSAALSEALDLAVKEEKHRHSYFVACLPALAARGFHIGYTLTTGLPWVEIDVEADLRRARDETLPQIQGCTAD